MASRIFRMSSGVWVPNSLRDVPRLGSKGPGMRGFRSSLLEPNAKCAFSTRQLVL